MSPISSLSRVRFAGNLLAVVLLAVAPSARAVLVASAASAGAIDPSGGAAIAYTNPNWSTGFSAQCLESFAAESPATLLAKDHVVVLDFETAHGFPAAAHAMAPGGTIFTNTSGIAPFSLSDALTQVGTASGMTIGVEWRSFNVSRNILAPDVAGANGVFLVQDRASTPVMVSGSQGLAWGAIFGTTQPGVTAAPGGAYFTFSQDLSDFGVTLNASVSTTYLVLLYDQAGVMIGKYQQGVGANQPVFFAVNSPHGLIRHVWIGHPDTYNGVVLDDMVFRPLTPATPAYAKDLTQYASWTDMSTNGWAKTSGTTVTTGASGATIAGTTSDAKIYRGGIALSAGQTYEISGTASGPLVANVTASLSSTNVPVAYLNLDAASGSRTDRQRFRVPASANYYLIAQESAGSGSSASVQNIAIEPVNDTPLPTTVASPAPGIVRGFDTTIQMGATDLPTFYGDAADGGANVVRIQVKGETYAAGQHEDFWTAWPAVLARLVTSVQKAQAAGLKVVIDMQEGPFTGGFSWDDDEQNDLDSAFCQAWWSIADAMVTNGLTGSVYAYDLCNEPNDTAQAPMPPRQWWPLATNIARTIRTRDTSTWLVYESGPGSYMSGFLYTLRPLPDARILYGAHFYYPDAYTAQDVNQLIPNPGPVYSYPGFTLNGTTWDAARLAVQVRPLAAFQQTWGVPVYVGEFSAIRWAPGAADWLQDVVTILEHYHWSWTYHAWREWNGWNLEYDDNISSTAPSTATPPSDRAAVLQDALQNPPATPPALP